MTQLADAELVAAAQGGDREALAQLYERYFDAVYDFAARLVRDRDEAADIAQETFLKAMNALGGLKQGASFRSWLFSIARNTALNRLERRARTRPLAATGDDGEPIAFDVVDPARFASPQEVAEAAAAARLVWEAAAGLDPRQLSLLDLHLRQGLDAEEIAGVLGITRNNAYVLLHRLKKAVESAISAYVLWKQAGERCPGLAGLLAPAAAAGGMTPEVRKAIDRHVERCDDCRERRKRLAPLAIFGGLAPVAAPPGARAAGLEQLLRNPPPPQPPREPALARSGRTPPARAPHGLAAPGFLRAGALLGVAAGALLLVVVLLMGPLAPAGDDGNGARSGIFPDVTPAPGGSRTIVIPMSPTASSPSAGSPTAATASPSPSPAPTGPGGGGGGTTTTTPTPSPAGTATATATASPSATPTPCTPSLSLPPGSGSTLVIPAGGQGSFQLQNTAACPADYSLTINAPWLLGPSGGSVAPASAVTITLRVSADALPAAEGDYPATVTVSGPGEPFTIAVTGRRGGQPPQILAATATCERSASSASTTLVLTVRAIDDVAVVRVTAATATGAVDLAPAGDGTWRRTVQFDGGSPGAITFTAFDGQERTATYVVTPAGCSG
jgi:RNA polymerase sigma factor (sigma-70 family)